ncbi:hypothetical protein AVBRAN9333_09025 [Campylobacter sp. RM9333]|uniref:hypothetical protein n=1 Tax=Campylobacter sp. RM9333 TaxID=2735731 RepID=UPI001DE4DAFE|nr:hypothetical protein [Campylobacter sp. RM9333]
MDSVKNNFRLDLIKCLSNTRLQSYKDLDEHFKNLKLISKLSPKIGILEITLRNYLNDILAKKFNNDDWLLDYENESIKEQINKLCKSKKRTPTKDELLSNLTLGTIIKIIEDEKIEKYIFSDLDLKRFDKNNKKYYFLNNKKTKISLIDKNRALLKLFLILRNRASHFENLLKLRNNKISNISYKLNQNYYISIDPVNLERFLDDLINDFNEDLISRVKLCF